MKNNKINLIIIGGIVIIAAIIAGIFLSPAESNKPAKPAAFRPTPKNMAKNFPPANLTKENLGPATFNWELKTIDGKTVVLSDYKGKVIFLNLWATWCGPCLAEFPSIQSLYSDMNDDVVFLMVSQEEFETVKAFSSRESYTFPFMVAAGEMPGVFETNVIPTTYIIDRSGTIVVKHVGATNWADESVKTFLKSL